MSQDHDVDRLVCFLARTQGKAMRNIGGAADNLSIDDK